MDQLIRNVFDEYFSTRIRLGGKALNVGTKDQYAILTEIPRLIESWLNSKGLGHLFKVKGSIGNGNIARVPWVGIFNKAVTENAENGYYIVLLFSENMASCFLSLNQGITAVENLYTKGFALRKMRETAVRAIRQIECDPEAYLGQIDLAASGNLGKSYEAAAILSFKYDTNNLPSAELFFRHLDYLLGCYDTLFKKFGKSLNSLITVTEGEFQQVVLEKAANVRVEEPLDDKLTRAEDVLKSMTSDGQGYVRSPVIAAEAIKKANFLCEIDPDHWTFTSRAKKQKYVEAHHLVPMCQQNKFFVTVDVVENIVSLCATCHRLLHFGVEEEKRSLLISLFEKRKEKLAAKSIQIKKKDFLQFYASGSLIED